MKILVYKGSCFGTQHIYFPIFLLFRMAFELQREHQVVLTEIPQPTKPKLFTIWPLIVKVYQLLASTKAIRWRRQKDTCPVMI